MAGRVLKSTHEKVQIPFADCSRNLDFKDTTGEDSEGREEHVIRNWGRGGLTI